MVVYTCDLSRWEVKAGGSGVQDCLLQSEVEATLGYMKRQNTTIIKADSKGVRQAIAFKDTK